MKITVRENQDGEWVGEGCYYYHWVIDWLAEQEPGVCSECGAQNLERGWVCLDDGSELLCEDCVEAIPYED